jgi:hypothetical protein
MAFSVTPQIGIDLNNIVTAANIAAGQQAVPNRLGEQVWGSDGKRYVLAQANASIPASTTAITISPSTFLATLTGGSYVSPAFAMVTGDYGWFNIPSV